MGGLWEAAVKSAKMILNRTIHDQILTYEELNTIFHRVEATLNSRPLGTMDLNDPQPLTAGHFFKYGTSRNFICKHHYSYRFKTRTSPMMGFGPTTTTALLGTLAERLPTYLTSKIQMAQGRMQSPYWGSCHSKRPPLTLGKLHGSWKCTRVKIT